MSGIAVVREDAHRLGRGAPLAALGLALACALAAAGIDAGPAIPGPERGGDDARPVEEVIDEYRDHLFDDWI